MDKHIHRLSPFTGMFLHGEKPNNPDYHGDNMHGNCTQTATLLAGTIFAMPPYLLCHHATRFHIVYLIIYFIIQCDGHTNERGFLFTCCIQHVIAHRTNMRCTIFFFLVLSIMSDLLIIWPNNCFAPQHFYNALKCELALVKFKDRIGGYFCISV